MTASRTTTDRSRRRRGGRLAAAIVLAGLVAVVTWQLAGRWERWTGSAWQGDVRQLPEQMQVEEVITNLSATFDPSAVVAEAPEMPVRVGRLEPGFKLHVGGRGRRAIVASPPSHLRFRVRVPPGAKFHFGAGAEGDGRRDRNTRGVRFMVDVDGREAFTQVINPAARRGDRRWFDASVDLGGEEEREVEIGLHAQAVGAGPRIGGTPGWSHLRVVQTTVRERQPASRTAPSVLVLLVDTLRSDRLGCYGARPSRTPVLDGLARDGLLFQQVISQSAWTMPAVASLFTGLPPRSHGLVGVLWQTGDGSQQDRRHDTDPSYLPDSLSTLAARAQAAGITTVGVSTNPLVSRGTNLARGFETFLEAGYTGQPPTWRRAEDVNRVFLQWLGKNSEYRFLAYLHYMDVHGPYQPPEPYKPPPPRDVRPRVANGEVSAIAKKVDEGRGAPLTAAELDYLRALYDGEVRYWDAQLAVLLDGLSAAGVRESTVLVVTADHGEEFLEHGRLKHAVHLYEELIRVPLVVAGPGVGAGTVEEQVQLIDLFPTVASLLEMDAPGNLPGKTLMAPPKGRPAVSETRWGVSPEGVPTELVSLRTSEWKLIYHLATQSFELYDLTSDPGEQENLHGVAREGATLARMLKEWQATTPPPPAAGGSDPEFRDKLRALGYVE